MKNALLSLAAAVLLLSACGKKEEPAAQSDSQAGTAQAAVPGYQKKDTYFRLPGAAGGEVDLAAYAGKPVLLMFFTETCPYCRKAAPFIKQVAESYAPKGLAAVGVCVQAGPEPAANFGRDFGLAFPLAYNGGPVSRAYKTQGVPYIFLLTPEHEIYDVWAGYDQRYDASIIKAVETVLAGRKG